MADVASKAASGQSRSDPSERLRLLRTAFLAIVAFDFALIAGQLLIYPTLLAKPGSLGYIAEPVVLLVVYAGLGIAATVGAQGCLNSVEHTADRLATLQLATVFGLLSGGLWLLNHTLETFVDTSSWGLL